jgi:hypothetical protein
MIFSTGLKQRTSPLLSSFLQSFSLRAEWTQGCRWMIGGSLFTRNPISTSTVEYRHSYRLVVDTSCYQRSIGKIRATKLYLELLGIQQKSIISRFAIVRVVINQCEIDNSLARIMLPIHVVRGSTTLSPLSALSTGTRKLYVVVQ